MNSYLTGSALDHTVVDKLLNVALAARSDNFSTKFKLH